MVSQERYLPKIQDEWSSLREQLKAVPKENQLIINKAFHFARNAHRDMKRASGEPYFSHVQEVTRILAEDCQITDANILATGLLHDVVEDTPAASDTKDYDNTTSRRMSWESLKKEFNVDIADWVLSISKPKVEGIEIKDKYQRDHVMKRTLSGAAPQALLVKMGDRLHNLRTLEFVETKSKRDATLIETETSYIPLFTEKVKPVFPEAYEYLLKEMRIAMQPYTIRSSEVY